jgi:steroid delta-isomerase-like uncharacterized protein
MSAADNKALVRRFFDLVNATDLDAVAALCGPGYQLHFDGMPTVDAAGAMGMFGQFLAAFPGIHHEVLGQIAEGDRVATRIVVRGTQTADFTGIPASGQTIGVGSINIHVIADGRFVEQWINSDSLGMMQQLGAIPAPAASHG